jgi:hypothetical protein
VPQGDEPDYKLRNEKDRINDADYLSDDEKAAVVEFLRAFDPDDITYS